MTHERSVTILKIAAIVFELFGVLMILSLLPGMAGVLTPLVQLATLDGGATAPYASVEGRFLAAVLGGVTIGLGTAVWMITTQVYADDPIKGGPLLLVPTVAWFVTDGIGSVLAGAPFNIVLNVSFLALVAVPVIASRRNRAVA